MLYSVNSKGNLEINHPPPNLKFLNYYGKDQYEVFALISSKGLFIKFIKMLEPDEYGDTILGIIVGVRVDGVYKFLILYQAPNSFRYFTKDKVEDGIRYRLGEYLEPLLLSELIRVIKNNISYNSDLKNKLREILKS